MHLSNPLLFACRQFIILFISYFCFILPQLRSVFRYEHGYIIPSCQSKYTYVYKCVYDRSLDTYKYQVFSCCNAICKNISRLIVFLIHLSWAYTSNLHFFKYYTILIILNGFMCSFFYWSIDKWSIILNPVPSPKFGLKPIFQKVSSNCFLGNIKGE